MDNMSNIKLTGITTVTNEQVTFGVEDICTLYVVPSNGVGTFINPDTMEIEVTHMPITKELLEAIGFYHCISGVFGYKKELRGNLRLLWLVDLVGSLPAGIYVYCKLGYMEVKSMEDILTILKVVFWNRERYTEKERDYE